MTYTKSDDKNKDLLLKSTTAEQIQRHIDQIKQGLATCGLPPCPHCGLESGLFKPHESRDRKFYVVIEQIVVTFMGLLLRWKCPGCKKTKTDYPGFALPYKRYTLPTIMAFSLSYVEDPIVSYRGLIDMCPLEYKKTPDSEASSAPMMEFSTIHRWVSTMGRYLRIIRTATDLILQANPATTLCRDMAGLTVPVKKYRSPLRKKILLNCFQLLFLEPIYQSVFQVSVFPKLATNNNSCCTCIRGAVIF